MQYKEGCKHMNRVVEGRAREEKAREKMEHHEGDEGRAGVFTGSRDRLQMHPMPGTDIQVLGEKERVTGNQDQTTRVPLLWCKGGG